MFYLEFRDERGNWSNNIGDYNDFQTLHEAISVIPHLIECCNDFIDFDWRVRDENGEVVKSILAD